MKITWQLWSPDNSEYEIWSYHDDDSLDYGLLECEAV
jgi:hypothetical protein